MATAVKVAMTERMRICFSVMKQLFCAEMKKARSLQRFYKEIEEGERFGRLLLKETFIKAIQSIIV